MLRYDDIELGLDCYVVGCCWCGLKRASGDGGGWRLPLLARPLEEVLLLPLLLLSVNGSGGAAFGGSVLS